MIGACRDATYYAHMHAHCTCTCNSYLTLIGGARDLLDAWSNAPQLLRSCNYALLAHDPLSSLAYPMITHTPLVASNFPIKQLLGDGQQNQIQSKHVGCHAHPIFSRVDC